MPVFTVQQIYGHSPDMQQIINKYSINTIFLENIFIFVDYGERELPSWLNDYKPNLLREIIRDGNNKIVIYYHREYEKRDTYDPDDFLSKPYYGGGN